MGNACECQRADTVRPDDTPHTYVEPPIARSITQTTAAAMMAKKAPGSNTSTAVPQLTEDDMDSDQDSDADVVEDLPKPSKAYLALAKNRQSVSAEAYGEWNKRKAFRAPVYPKTPEQKERINRVLENNFLFNSLDPEELETVIGAFQEVSLKKGTTIIRQGDDGDRLYLIEAGDVNVYKRAPAAAAAPTGAAGAGVGGVGGGGGGASGGGGGDGSSLGPFVATEEDKFVTVMKPGDAFGELALMYNAPRAATVVAADDMLLWALDRDSFTNIVRDASVRKRERFEKALKDVPLLADMDPYERSKLADALRTKTYNDGDIIIREGDRGDTFFVLLDGSAEARKDNHCVMKYQRGSYFGEFALLKDQPRAATVIATSQPTLVAYFDRKSFKRLLGPVEQILMRNQENYRAAMEALGLDTKYLDCK